jgi:RNA polymerase sigma factor (sigma-70 family)
VEIETRRADMTAPRSLSASLQHLGRTLAARDLAGLSDAELVGRFAERRDEAAFTVLVRRYGRVVFGVCRRVLRHEQDAEDAFQAAFLVLARKAASVRRAGEVGNWLYGVAYNVARKAKAMRHRRELKERAAAAQPRRDTPTGLPDDLQEILDRELHALPDKYRAAVVLCDLGGLTIREAAAQVRCPPKTLGTRLSRGRSLLAGRLTRRGVTISAAALAAALAPCATAADCSRLIASTVQAAVAFAAGSATAVPPAVAALTQGVSNVMLSKTLKCVTVLACGVLALAGSSAGSQAGRRVGPSEPVVVVADALEPAARAAAEDAPRETKPVRTADHLHQHLHRVLVLLLHPIGLGLSPFVPSNSPEPDKDKQALSGTWLQKAGALKIEFSDKDVMKVLAHDGALTIRCEYTLGKDGLVKAKVTGLEGTDELKDKAKNHLPVGLAFRFTWKVKGDAATLEDLKGDNTEHLKGHLEGDYEKKK